MNFSAELRTLMIFYQVMQVYTRQPSVFYNPVKAMHEMTEVILTQDTNFIHRAARVQGYLQQLSSSEYRNLQSYQSRGLPATLLLPIIMVMLILFSIPMLILSSSVDAFSEKIVQSKLPEVPGRYCDRVCDRELRYHCVFNFRFETHQNQLNCSKDTRYSILKNKLQKFQPVKVQ